MTFGQIFGEAFGQLFGLMFDQMFDQLFGQVGGGQTIQCTVLLGRRKTVYISTGTEEQYCHLLSEVRKIQNSMLGTL